MNFFLSGLNVFRGFLLVFMYWLFTPPLTTLTPLHTLTPSHLYMICGHKSGLQPSSKYIFARESEGGSERGRKGEVEGVREMEGVREGQ